MIVKMDKYAFMVYHKEYNDFLQCLRSMGVVHIQQTKSGKDFTAIQQLMEERKRVKTQINYLQELLGKDAPKEIPLQDVSQNDGYSIINNIENVCEKVSEHRNKLQALEKEYEAIAVWGEFDYSNIERIRNAGYNITFHTCPAAHFDQEWIDKYNAFVINTIQATVYFITVTKSGTTIDIDADRAKLSDSDIHKLAAAIDKEKKSIEETENALNATKLSYYITLKNYERTLAENYEYNSVLIQTERKADDKIMLLEGWIPSDKTEAMERKLDESSAYFQKLKVTPDDNVPILLKNNWFSRLFEPIGDMYMLPKYNELDLTPYFAPFFMIFFGLCLGDSGYGLLLLTGATCARFIIKNIAGSMQAILSLIQILGISTMLCGLLTGTFFGANMYEWGLPQLDWFKTHVLMNNSQMFSLSLILGCIQILFGMVLKAVNKTIQFGFVHALSTIGWIVLLVSVAFAYLCPTILPMFGAAHLVIMGLAAMLIMFINSPGKNIFVNFGLGIWDAYNMATGLLGDVLSYVRLFALGLSGGILAGVFNSLATNMSPDNVVLGPIVTAIIFLAGHAMNIFMNILGAIVHPMRLTFVEFYKNSEFTGGGVRYTPFGKKEQTI